jgi:hypothetical protein
MEAGSMGSCYTTIEGLLAKLISELEEHNPFGKGDSALDRKFLDFINKLVILRDGK